MSQQIEGIFISFNKNEEKQIREGLEDLGYTYNVKGLKQFLIDNLSEVDVEDDGNEEINTTDKIIEQVRDYIDKNPDTINMYKNLAGNFLKKAFKKKG